MLGMGKLAKKVFGNANSRYIKRLQPRIKAINALEEDIQKLSDEELRAKTEEFRARLKDGATLDSLLVEAFATVREAAVRTLGQRHYDVQLIGGIVLHECKISEMKTGEGKTLVSTLAGYLNALPGKGVHIVTVNDYLASRDSAWMGRVFEFLGMTTGCIIPNMDDEARKQAYAADITYATNNELGFDYLRDNMKFHPDAMVQRPPAFAIVDEVDSILIDEARTPLIISGPTEQAGELYTLTDALIRKLDKDDYDLDEKDKAVSYTEKGMEHIEELYHEAGIQFIYFDGSEDAPRPYWFNIQMSKLITYNAFKPAPIFSEGAVKAHFGWHIQSRGNGFDTFEPKFVKEAVRKHPASEAMFLANDFTSLNFGWNDYVAPDKNTIGMQPDMFEYITSRAAAWNCPIAMLGKLDQLQNHPRTADNLEVIRRWEEVRIMDFLTEKQKESLKDLDQEHTLLINEEGDFELVPYTQIINIANGNKDIRAFVFTRNNKTWVVYWHCRAEGSLILQVGAGKIQLFEKLGGKMPIDENQEGTIVPLGNRKYLSFDLSRKEVIELFKNAKLQ
ncbi:MAG: hypothetical protein L3J50_12120 [Emcibacter sp.]|nr:hypothetical protein [Emcibacter sp.]